MSDIFEDALTILRILYEAGAYGSNELLQSDVLSDCRLPQEDFSKAIRYLYDKSYIYAIGNVDGGGRIKIIPKGVDFIQLVMDKRLPLTLNAEKIIKYLVETVTIEEPFLIMWEIKKGVGIGSVAYENACQLLLDFDLIDIGVPDEGQYPFDCIFLTQKGRQAYHRRFKDIESDQLKIHTGPTFHAPVITQNLQAITNAINSTLDQSISISESDPELLKRQISEILSILVEQVGSELNLQQREQYTHAATEIEKELAKGDPETKSIQKWLAILSFLDTSLSVGERLYNLSIKALPYVLAIERLIQEILEQFK